MTSETRAATIDHPIGSSGSLSVKVASADVFLVPSADDHVRVRTLDGRPLPDHVKVETEGDTVAVREAGRFLGVSVSIGDGHSVALEIEVPTTAATTIQTASGSVAANGLRGEQQFRTASGEVRLDHAAGQITTETVSGDVVIGVVGTVELIVKTVSGDVAIEGERIERVRLTTTSGDIYLVSSLGSGPHAIETLSGDAIIGTDSGVRVTARTVSGDLRSDLPHTADGMMGRRSLTVGDGSVELTFRSVSGDLRVIDPAKARERRRPAAPARAVPVAPSAPIAPNPPVAPAAPELPLAPAMPVMSTDDATDVASHAPATTSADDRRLEILRALERGEIDIVAAGDQLALLDEPTDG
jgi:hypothetical protein